MPAAHPQRHPRPIGNSPASPTSAQRHGGGYAHVTTRANLQVREIEPKNAVAMVEGILDLGLCSRGSGADNIRNVTGTPTAGIDPQELIDTRPYAREWHFHILNERALYGLPRKFNVGFDGGGIIPVLEDTNDIGFQAVAVKDGFGLAPGVWFRLLLGGITGHKDFGRETGVVVKPAEATAVADAVVRVFIDHGDRTNRLKARLKYVLDRFGMEKFLARGRGEARPPADPRSGRRRWSRARPSTGPPISGCTRRSRTGSIGSAWCCRSASSRPRKCAGSPSVARDLGDGEIRLTVWQNLLISGVPAQRIGQAAARSRRSGSRPAPTSIRAGLVACTGNIGCKFAASDTKGHAEEIARWCEARVELDAPINIHLTGCHHSCAQHYVGDIGLLACKVQETEDGEQIEGYHVLVGGGFGPDAALAREIYRDVKATDVPATVERMLKGLSGPARIEG